MFCVGGVQSSVTAPGAAAGPPEDDEPPDDDEPPEDDEEPPEDDEAPDEEPGEPARDDPDEEAAAPDDPEGNTFVEELSPQPASARTAVIATAASTTLADTRASNITHSPFDDAPRPQAKARTYRERQVLGQREKSQ